MPTVQHITRTRGDTFAERIFVDTAVTGATFALNVETLAALTGSIVSSSTSASYVDFAVSNVLVSNGASGSYDFDVVMTSGGLTRTLIQGTWTIVARTAS